MYVCMSVRNRLKIQICIIYVPVWHMPSSRWRSRTGRIEDDSRLENESRDIEDG